MRSAHIILLAALWGCTEGNGPETGTSTVPSDTDIDTVSAQVTVHATLDGASVDPLELTVHLPEGDTGKELKLAEGETGTPFTVEVPETSDSARVWIGPSDAATTADGHRIVELDGNLYVHEVSDFTVGTTGTEATVALNQMPVEEGMAYNCETQKYYYDEDAEDYHGEFYRTVDGGTHALYVVAGSTIVNPDDPDWGGSDEALLNSNDRLYVSGSAIMFTSPDTETFLESSEILENGFTVSLVAPERLVYDMRCTLDE